MATILGATMDNPSELPRQQFGRRTHGAAPKSQPKVNFLDYLKKLRRKYWPGKVMPKGKRLGNGRSRLARPDK